MRCIFLKLQLMSKIKNQTSLKTLFSKAQISKRVDALAQEIVADYPKEFLVIVILKGSFVFAADLIRALETNGGSAQVDFISLSSYGLGSNSSGTVTVKQDLIEDVSGRPVLVIDDILESGRTISFAVEMMKKRQAATVKTCLLLDKPGRRKVDIEADYVGFKIDPHFVVGYGLDLANKYRGLPYIGIIENI